MNDSHRIKDFFEKVTFDDYLGAKNHPTNTEKTYSRNTDEDDERFLSGEDYDDAEEESFKGFDTGDSKCKDDTTSKRETPVIKSKPEDNVTKIRVLFAGSTMELFFNPAYYDVPERELLKLLTKFADENHCIDGTVEVDYGIITVRFNPTIHDHDDINLVGHKVAEFIDSKKEG